MSIERKLSLLVLATVIIVILLVAINYGKQIWPIISEWFINLWKSANQ